MIRARRSGASETSLSAIKINTRGHPQAHLDDGTSLGRWVKWPECFSAPESEIRERGEVSSG